MKMRGQWPSYAVAGKTKSLSLHTHGCFMAFLTNFSPTSSTLTLLPLGLLTLENRQSDVLRDEDPQKMLKLLPHLHLQDRRLRQSADKEHVLDICRPLKTAS